MTEFDHHRHRDDAQETSMDGVSSEESLCPSLGRITDTNTPSTPSFSLLPRQHISVMPSPLNEKFSDRKSPISILSMRKRRAYSLNGPLNVVDTSSSTCLGMTTPKRSTTTTPTTTASSPDPSGPDSSCFTSPLAALGDLCLQSPKANHTYNKYPFSNPVLSRSPFSQYCGAGASPYVEDLMIDTNTNTNNSTNSSTNSSSLLNTSPPKKVPLTVLSNQTKNNSPTHVHSKNNNNNNNNSSAVMLTPKTRNNYKAMMSPTVASPAPIRLFSPNRNDNAPTSNPGGIPSTPTPSSTSKVFLSPRIQASPFSPQAVMKSPHPLPKMILSPRISNPSSSVQLPPESPCLSTGYIPPPDPNTKKLAPSRAPLALLPNRNHKNNNREDSQDFMGKQMDGLLRGFGNHSKKQPTDANNISHKKANGPPILTLSLEKKSAPFTHPFSSSTAAKRVTPSSFSYSKNRDNGAEEQLHEQPRAHSLLSPPTNTDEDVIHHLFTNKNSQSYDSDESISDMDDDEDDNDNFFLSSPSAVIEAKNDAASHNNSNNPNNNIPFLTTSFQQKQEQGSGRSAKHRKVFQDESRLETTHSSAQDPEEPKQIHFESITSAASLYGMDIIQENSISNVSLVEMNLPQRRRSINNSLKYNSNNNSSMMRSESSDSILSGCGLNLEEMPLFSSDGGRDLITPPVGKQQTQIMLSPPPIRETNLTTSYNRYSNDNDAT